MGLSGISTWGSDIGGFFALFDDELTPELLIRWVQFGAVSGVMRTAGRRDRGAGEAAAAGLGPGPDRQLAALREAAHPALSVPGRGRRAVPAQRAADHAPARPRVPRRPGRRRPRRRVPVRARPARGAGARPGATERPLYLPRGRWVDLWRSVRYRDGDGALRLRRAKVLRGAGEVDGAGAARRAAAARPRGHGAPAAAGGRRHAQPTTRTSRRRRSPTAPTGSALLAFPRGKSSAGMFEDERIRSRERGRGWALRIKGERRRDVSAAGLAEDALERRSSRAG